MLRETSLQAFRHITENGLLSERRQQVYEALYTFGPCTANELGEYLRKSSSHNANLVTRLGELRDCGVVREAYKRACKITGMTVIVWDVTNGLPQKIKKQRRKCDACNGTGRVRL